jgi:hypothetical protein
MSFRLLLPISTLTALRLTDAVIAFGQSPAVINIA